MLLTLLPSILALAGSLFSTLFGKLMPTPTSSINVNTATSVAETQAALKTQAAMLQVAVDTPNQAAAVAALETGNA